MNLYSKEPYPQIKVACPLWMGGRVWPLWNYIELLLLFLCYVIAAIPLAVMVYYLCGCPERFLGSVWWAGILILALFSHGVVAMLWHLMMVKSAKIRWICLNVSARLGFPHAQYQLGSKLLSQTGYDKVSAVTMRWLLKAAACGHVFAMWKLARVYSGKDVLRYDLKRAYECFKEAARGGHVGAICALGRCYEDGAGVDKNFGDAATCYLAAAKYGLASAQHNIACCFKHGIGVKKDKRCAALWFDRADQNGLYDFATKKNETVKDYALMELLNLKLLFDQPMGSRQFSDEYLANEMCEWKPDEDGDLYRCTMIINETCKRLSNGI